MPRAALIVTVHNGADYLAAALDSALGQSFADFELILWDDGSDDGSAEIARNYANRDPRIHLTCAPHQGRVASLRGAIAASTAPCFGLLDADDLLMRDALAATVPVIERDPDTAIVYTNHRIMDAAGHDQGIGPRCATPYSMERLLVSQMVFHFRLFSREIYDEVGGFDPNFPAAEDYDLVLRLSEAGDILHVPEALYSYRVHTNNLSTLQRAAQTRDSQRAVEAALARRGVGDKLAVHVSEDGRFSLVPR